MREAFFIFIFFIFLDDGFFPKIRGGASVLFLK